MRCAVVLVLVCVYGRACLGARVDDLFRARCAASCMNATGNRNKCESECILVTHSKPGDCPRADDLSKFEGACIPSCTEDRDCPGTEKCCAHHCGRTCQHAVHLDLCPGLPRVPSNVTVSEAGGARNKVVRWTLGPSLHTNGQVLYVLQERRHLGTMLQEEMFGAWRARGRRRNSRVVLTDLTPAHWYQVRVAAVNSNGTRGFSAPSLPFTLNADPNKPGEPRNLTVVHPGWVEGKLWAEIRWRRPHSDIPLHHYKVSWSHCVKADDLEVPDNNCKAKSVIVKNKSVNYKSTNFILRNLKPHSLYFIQVQAVTVQYGLKKKLFSEHAVFFLYTNKYINATYNWKSQVKNLVKNLTLSKFYRTNTNNLEVKVMWNSSPGRFLVKWAPVLCSKTELNKPSYNAITEDLQYELDHLNFDCKYQVSVKAISSNKYAKLSFSTPLCSQVSSKLPCDSKLSPFVQ